MSLATDHHGKEYFNWPIHDGKDLSWLKNHETWTSIFAFECQYDFFGAYEVDADRGIVQFANHHVLPGKKAWTWGNWDFGLASQKNLTDEDGPYIEVQSGPLPTQSDYGMLGPRDQVSWQEWWYPIHGLGDGFEFATKDVAIQTERSDSDLRLRLIATDRFPGATCTLEADERSPVYKRIGLSPDGPVTVTVSNIGQLPARVTVTTGDGDLLGSFTTPLPVPKPTSPDPATFEDKPDDQLTAEQRYLKGRWSDRATDRLEARKYYELALEKDSGHVLALRALAVLDLEAGLYEDAMSRLTSVLDRDGDDGLAWYFRGVCQLSCENTEEAVACGYRTARCFGARSLGYDLVGRAYMRLGEREKAVAAFREAANANPNDARAKDHLMLALYATQHTDQAFRQAEEAVRESPTGLVPGALLALKSDSAMKRFVGAAREFVGEDDFEMIETSLVFADLGLFDEAGRLLRAACVNAVPKKQRSLLPLYYLAYFASRQGDDQSAHKYLEEAASISRDFVFPSRREAVDVLSYAINEKPGDANAHLHLGNLYGDLGRVDEAVAQWEKAVQLDTALSIPFRNLGLASLSRERDLSKAAEHYRKAIAARGEDQTLYRDLAEILVADGKRPEAIRLIESMPIKGQRRSELTIMLAEAYVAEERYADAIDLLESTPYFVNWEGQDITWVLFNRAHLERGQQRFEQKQFKAALEDFEAALTYPENLGVGRTNQPQEAPAEYWRGKALEALGRLEEARSAWKKGASGHEGSDEQDKYRQLCKEAIK